MTVTLSHIKKINTYCNANNIDAELLYPNLLIFENNTCVHIVNLLGSNEETQHQSGIHRFDYEISDKILIEHFLLLVFKSGDIIAIDVSKGTQIEITNDTNTSLKICQIRRYEDRLYFVSESGDSFMIPLPIKDLVGKLENNSKLSMPFKKTHVSHLNINEKHNSSICGMNIFVEAGSVKAKCPITGLYEVISTELSLCHVVSWADLVVFVNENSMWIVDIKESQIIYEFEKMDVNYYPVVVHNDLFYYLLWSKNEVRNILT